MHGVYGYPVEKACRIALKKISDFLDGNEAIEKVVVVCFSEMDLNVYHKAFLESA